jgi:hypothetical protein
LCEKDLSGADYVNCWANGLHFGVRLDADRICALVIIGVRADGKKELIAPTDGHRESTESRASLLRDARRPGAPPGAGGRRRGAGALGGAAGGVLRPGKGNDARRDRNRDSLAIRYVQRNATM